MAGGVSGPAATRQLLAARQRVRVGLCAAVTRYSGADVTRRLAAPIALSLLSLLACRTVPADVSLSAEGSEPARTGPFVEAQPQTRELPSGTFTMISADIANLYRC